MSAARELWVFGYGSLVWRPAHLDEAGAPGSRRALMYLATPANPDYLGPAEPAAIVAQILGARGPSGANVEYLLRLAEALRALAADDPHVFELERMVRSRLDGRG